GRDAAPGPGRGDHDRRGRGDRGGDRRRARGPAGGPPTPGGRRRGGCRRRVSGTVPGAIGAPDRAQRLHSSRWNDRRWTVYGQAMAWTRAQKTFLAADRRSPQRGGSLETIVP